MAQSKNKRPQFKRPPKPALTQELEAFINGAEDESPVVESKPSQPQKKVVTETRKNKPAPLLKPKKKTKIKLFNLRMSHELHSSIEELANQLNISMHEVIHTLVRRGVEAERKAHGLD